MPKATRLRTTSKLLALLLIPAILYTIPLESIYNGESLCLFKRFLNTECWGCGITRAFFSVLYGHFTLALEYNPLITIVFPLFAWLWLKEIFNTAKKLKAQT